MFGVKERSIDRTFGDQISSSHASNGGEESPGQLWYTGFLIPLSGSPLKKKSWDSRKGREAPQPSTVNFMEDARSICFLTQVRKAEGSVKGGHSGSPVPGMGHQVVGITSGLGALGGQI